MSKISFQFLIAFSEIDSLWKFSHLNKWIGCKNLIFGKWSRFLIEERGAEWRHVLYKRGFHLWNPSARPKWIVWSAVILKEGMAHNHSTAGVKGSARFNFSSGNKSNWCNLRLVLVHFPKECWFAEMWKCENVKML